MPEYVNRKIVKQVIGVGAEDFDVALIEEKFKLSFIVPRKSKITTLDAALAVYDTARLLRACYNEDEGVTYP